MKPVVAVSGARKKPLVIVSVAMRLCSLWETETGLIAHDVVPKWLLNLYE